jgi:hypothetical protein
MENTILKYSEQEKSGKVQIYNFIKKTYPQATKRDVISGLHSAIIKDGSLIGVSTDLGRVKIKKNY